MAVSWQLAPCLVKLRGEVNARWPDRDKRSDGTIGDPAHSARTSSHNPDGYGLVRAWDVTDSRGVAQAVVDHLVARRDPRIRYVIWQGRIWFPSTGWRDYAGANPHDKHAHINAEYDERAMDATSFGIYPPQVPPEVDDMAQVPQEQWNAVVAAISRVEARLDVIQSDVGKTKVAVGRLDALRPDLAEALREEGVTDPDAVADRVAARLAAGIAVEGRLTVKES